MSPCRHALFLPLIEVSPLLVRFVPNDQIEFFLTPIVSGPKAEMGGDAQLTGAAETRLAGGA